jgi:hypothetical protein
MLLDTCILSRNVTQLPEQRLSDPEGTMVFLDEQVLELDTCDKINQGWMLVDVRTVQLYRSRY